MQDKTGQKVPSVTFRARQAGEWYDIHSEEYFKGRKVIVFALPGAYTPTCSSTHLPRYDDLAGEFKKHGVDAIACLSVNDGFVMEAWGQNQKTKHIDFLPDGNGEFSEKIGMLVSKTDIGFGSRSWRYSMLVNDGVIEKMFIEPDKPGDPFEVSDADTMLKYLDPNAKLPAEVTILTKPGCPFCTTAKQLLTERGLAYEEISLGSGVSYKSVRNLTGEQTVPQIFIDQQHIKGSEALAEYFKKQ